MAFFGVLAGGAWHEAKERLDRRERNWAPDSEAWNRRKKFWPIKKAIQTKRPPT